MLYQTPYPLLLHFHPFPSSSSTIPLTPSSPLPPPQAETEMECVETALKSSLRKDTTTVKLSPQTQTQTQTFVDELSNAQQNGTSCDDFFVDDLLDFSHVVEEQQDSDILLQHHKKEEEQEENSTCVFSLQQHNHTHEICNELNVPTEDVADLEWLSHFVDDSFTEFSVAIPPENPTKNLQPEPKREPVFTQPCFKTPVQTKARSKRTRTSVRVWPFGSTSFTTESSTSSTTTSSSISSSPTSPLLICLDQLCFPAAPAKKPKKKASLKPAAVVQVSPPPRRCTHCGVQKTPQWRTGPLGAKTLCNACGVRFKSGRLLPEYRPACSPTFSSELHSNHHRKVLEMRRKKEVTTSEFEVEIETGLNPASVVPNL